MSTGNRPKIEFKSLGWSALFATMLIVTAWALTINGTQVYAAILAGLVIAIATTFLIFQMTRASTSGWVSAGAFLKAVFTRLVLNHIPGFSFKIAITGIVASATFAYQQSYGLAAIVAAVAITAGLVTWYLYPR